MADWTAWLGRRIEQRDVLTPASLARFRATIDSDATGDIAAQAIHWCLCLPDAPTAALGPDGHPLRQDDPGSFMPPIPLPRRMWAASDVRFHAPIAAGAQIARTSTLAAIKEKNGASGQLVFAEVEHETRANDVLAVSERQT
uniref:FAS1-like dehydratase domain-containing protein n=1 Tax=Sphingopyxis sp. KK2 TaxID=1855727 RepID=UPI0015C3C35F